MPSPNYQQNKKHIYKWVANNPERKRELCRLSQMRYDTWKRIQKEFRNILI